MERTEPAAVAHTCQDHTSYVPCLHGVQTRPPENRLQHADAKTEASRSSPGSPRSHGCPWTAGPNPAGCVPAPRSTQLLRLRSWWQGRAHHTRRDHSVVRSAGPQTPEQARPLPRGSKLYVWTSPMIMLRTPSGVPPCGRGIITGGLNCRRPCVTDSCHLSFCFVLLSQSGSCYTECQSQP